MKIQVLGSGCPTCKTLHKNVQDVVAKLGMNIEVEYSTDIAEIVKFGAMGSPVFVIDGEVMVAGKAPNKEEIEKMIKEKCSADCKDASESCACGGNC